ncbi:phosphoribosylamine--glycine ligase [Edaphobacter modestus]|uniref:Phosphoribosylamine--glycine ligase n=1 Tax=Edaphobacter modestus TaxID=388466 RepID=A0A4Q7YW45_9BACT|nr:phosphoribosylamine--glycine ligase [Edaphobacter modestus]RZU42027.1 phosphoribosylamine--glycine ligase [Edaphobacter modestus]
MKVLVIGGGGREHALVWALHKSPSVTEIVAAPGNGGMGELARCLPVDVNNLHTMVDLVAVERPDLTVIGPEVPLALGLVDELESRRYRVFGPTKDAAQLESSKAFAKTFMQRHGIPTAEHALCTTLDEVRESLLRFSVPVVVKASGLAAGKGVVICNTRLEAERTAAQMFSGVLLGAAETEVVLEEFLTGEEVSFFALCDGKHAVPIAAAQDHKRVGEGDTGPNTGGMGAYSTDGLLTPAMRQWIMHNVAQKVVDGMASEGTPFKGILFIGLMMTPRGPMVLEFNTRWGDPETEAIVLRLETDILDLFNASIDGTANTVVIRMKPGASATVIAASGGYPGKYVSGLPITGLDQSDDDGVIVFHAGTAIKDGQLVTAGGRVLAVTAESADLRDALNKIYERLKTISFDGMQYRRDIGHRALRS